MRDDWLDDDGRLLGSRAPLPLDEPFTRVGAGDLGVSRRAFDALRVAGLIRPVLRGVWAASQAPNDLQLRAEALALVIDERAVVVDRTAAWLHGIDLLPRSAVLTPPPLEVVHTDDSRVRRPEVDGRRRGLLASDVTVVAGVRVTTVLRTGLDLGRLARRYDAIAALDGCLRAGVPHELLGAEVGRFRGYRGVRQLREIVPLASPLAESAPESALRLLWIDAGLPRPTPQLWVRDDDGAPRYRLDLADPEVRFAAEYDGRAFRTTDADRAHDAERRQWLERRGWRIEGFVAEDVYGPRAPTLERLWSGYARARRDVRRWTPSRRRT